MLFASILDSLRRIPSGHARQLAHRPSSPPRQRPRRRTFRPAFESLEDRTALSTLTVLNNADSGPGSLRNALDIANNGDQIFFNHHLASETITLTSGPLAINTSVAITGLGAN